MRKLIVALAILFGMFGGTTVAQAITVTPNGVTADVQYKEPSTNANGTPLSDLKHCTVYAKPAAPSTGAEIKFAPVAASSGAGGQVRTTSITVTSGAVYDVTVSCSDQVGNESARSTSVPLDGLPPNKPE